MSARTLSAALDHVVVLVEDLDAAADSFGALGFIVTQTAQHSPEMGTANRCIMLATTYIELLKIVRPTERNAGWRALLTGGPGLRGLALRSDDVEATAARLAQRGLLAGPPLSFSRVTGNGTLEFSVVRASGTADSGLQLFACQHRTSHLLWTPQKTVHTNGAADLAKLTVPCRDCALAASAVEEMDTGSGRRTLITLTDTASPGRIAVNVAGKGATGPARSFDLTGTCGLVLELGLA
jgi:hypothetical protein